MPEGSTSPLPMDAVALADTSAASILDELPDVVIRYDARDRVLYANAALERVTGIPRATFIGRTGAEAGIDRHTATTFAEARQRVFATGRATTFRLQRTTADGLRQVDYRIVPEADATGRVVTVVAIGRDVTEYVETESARQESERQLATLLSNVPGVAYRVRDDERRTPEFVSEGSLAITGHPAEAFLSGRIDFEALIVPDDRARRRVVMRAALDGGTPFEVTYRLVRADGTLRWVWEQGREVPGRAEGEAAIEGLVVDVTDREEARHALEAERSRLAEAQRIGRLGAWSWNAVSRTLHISDEWARVFGPVPDGSSDPDLLFRPLLAPEDRAKFDAHVARIRTERLHTSEGRWTIVRPDGGRRTVHLRSEWQFGDDGAMVAGKGTFQDVTEQVLADARLARQQTLLEESQRLAGVGSWELTLETNEVTWSPEMYRIAGIEPEDEPLTLERVRQFMHPDDQPKARVAVAEALATGMPTSYEMRIVRPNGTVRHVVVRTRRVDDPQRQQTRIVGSTQDVTERKQLEEQVHQAQKMEALGLLAGGVAHDFNNLLSAIIGGAELARGAVDDDSQAARDLEDVREAGRRAAGLTRQLLAFSRKQTRRPRVLDLGDAVSSAEKLLRRLLSEDVVLDIARSDDATVVRADPGQLEQVLMNLVVNARDAIVARAESEPLATRIVTVETERLSLAEGDPRLACIGAEPLPPGDYASLAVHDTGTGMDATTLAHVFEPFFTTKAQGQGTGLGLATVFGIVAQSEGTVLVESALGTGTTFTVLLPIVAAPVDAPQLGIPALPRGTETILLVEDERAVRETAARILERHGYTVISARHGGDAVLAWRERGGEIDAVITDMRMPEVGGQTLVGWLRAERPDLPVVVISGYSAGQDEGEAALFASTPVLQKPFSTESLLVHLRAAIDKDI